MTRKVGVMGLNEVETGQDNNELKQIESLNGVAQTHKGNLAHLKVSNFHT